MTKDLRSAWKVADSITDEKNKDGDKTWEPTKDSLKHMRATLLARGYPENVVDQIIQNLGGS
jgi:hypothetical protein